MNSPLRQHFDTLCYSVQRLRAGLRGIQFEQFVKLPVSYKGELIGDYEADFVIEGKIILEIKAVTTLHPRHEAQAIHYLTATGFKLAILLNPSIGFRYASYST